MIHVERDDLVILLEAGYIYLAMRKFTEAKNIFEGVSVLAPKHDIPIVAIANVYFAQTKFLEAIRTLKKAIQCNEKSAFAYSHLGEAQLFYGKKEEALKSLSTACKLDPKGKSGEFAKSLIGLVQAGYDPKEFRKKYEKSFQEAKQKHQKVSS